MFKIFSAILVCASSLQCVQKQKLPQELGAILKSSHRSEQSKARDKYRNPEKTLQFFEVEPGMDVVEVSPGGGWYTEILAPYVDGTLYVAAFDDQSSREYYRKTNKKLKDKINKHRDIFGDVKYTVLEMPSKIGPIAPASSVDRVLTFRNVHNWDKAGKAKEVFKEFYRVLKDGGILGVVEHRASKKSPKSNDKTSGYMYETEVIALAKAAGFRLQAKSEINANPRDTAIHPKGVWTLPPRLALGEKNRDKYLKIGESDRMTLKFVK